MVSIFDYLSYREYLEAWITSQGSRSYGMKGKLAKQLGVSSSLVSQILKGERLITTDQTSDLCDFIGLHELESDYLHLLVDLDRTGNPRYREKVKRKLASIRELSNKIGKRVPRKKELTEEQKAIFYSSWLYTAIFNMAAVPTMNHIGAIAEHLQIDMTLANRIVNFLIENGLFVEEKGLIHHGPTNLHVDNDSPFVNKHHQNWRLQAIQQMEHRRQQDLFFTSPVSLSAEAAAQIRTLLPNVIQTVMAIVEPSPSERTACLNIDWFEF